MTKQGQAWGWGLPNSPTQGGRNPGTEPSLPPGRAGALWPGGCPVPAWSRRGGGAAVGREGGGKIPALPLAAGSLAGFGGGSGSGGSTRPGAPHSPAPLRPTQPGPWMPGWGLGGVKPT